MIFWSLSDCLYQQAVPQPFKVAVMRPLLKRPTVDPGLHLVLISNHPFLSKTLEKTVTNQMCNFLHNNCLIEDSVRI